jgi:hypothetical protein
MMIVALLCMALAAAACEPSDMMVASTPTPDPALELAATSMPKQDSTVPEAGILWSADHETGDLSQWDDVAISSTAEAYPSTGYAHSGRYSVALAVRNAIGADESPGVRMTKTTISTSNTLPDEGYYSVWYYFPQAVQPDEWWNIFQWKRVWVRDKKTWSDPVYTINVADRPDGSMYLYLYSQVGEDGGYGTPGVGSRADSAIDLPTNRWVHLECYYRWSLAPDGRIACWQDGLKIWDVTGLITDYDYGDVPYPRQWSVNNYTNATDPPTHTLYIDDAAISTERIGFPWAMYVPAIRGGWLANRSTGSVPRS